MAYDPDNIFARIVRGEIPCVRVHEDADTLAFMDLMPQSEGHTLVVPKVAGENLMDTPPDSLAAAILTTQRIARAVRAAFGPAGLIITQFNGPAAGQTVFHLHFHLIPRWIDAPPRAHGEGGMADAKELAALAAQIAAKIAG